MSFTGRGLELATLNRQLDGIKEGYGATRGRAIIVTGRRRIGKSRLIQEFCARSNVPTIIFQATRGRNPSAERADFLSTVSSSGVPGADFLQGVQPTDWTQALRVMASVIPEDRPSIVVLDEVPWLAEEDSEFEGALQTVWDQYLSNKPVLFLLIGSNQSVMEGLQDHDRPFFGRASLMRVDPLNPADVADMTKLNAADALDAWLITGGFPQIISSWRKGEKRSDFVARSFADPLSPLLVSAELTLLGEFSGSFATRAVLEAIGSGERTFSTIARAAGGSEPMAAGTLAPLLKSMCRAGLVADELPLSIKSGTSNRRYLIADPYLRFWLAFGASATPLADRGLGDMAAERAEKSWESWRGRAIEPIIRDSVERLCLAHQINGVTTVGGWWNRKNNPEIDLVGADRGPVARKLGFIGSIKWREKTAFDRHDYDELAQAASVVPGAAKVPLVAVSRSGFQQDLPLTYAWSPEDLLQVWRNKTDESVIF